MQRWTTFALRAAFILGFLVVLPVIALPSVARFLDEMLYGTLERTVPIAPDSSSLPAPRTSGLAQAIPASLEVPVPDDSLPPEGARVPTVPPPEFRSVPDFLPAAEPPVSSLTSQKSASEVSPLDKATAKKIDAIRRQLEELGAAYVRLEMSEDGLSFHCFCEMQLKNGGRTQSFEATRNDPVAAAEAVLAEVDGWRKGESSAAGGSKRGPELPPR
jgi:hypothetical protein